LMETKTCNDCGLTKPLSEFPLGGKYRGGRRYHGPRCKSCANIYEQARKRERRSWPTCPRCGERINPRNPSTEIRGKFHHIECAQAEILEMGITPITRAECPTERPCPVTHCRLNLAGEDVYGGREPLSGCVADILDAEPYRHTLDRIGDLFGVCRERVRQIEEEALGKLRAACEAEGLDPDEFIHALETWHMVESIDRNRTRGVWRYRQRS